MVVPADEGFAARTPRIADTASSTSTLGNPFALDLPERETRLFPVCR